MARKMIDYVELTLMGLVYESDMTNAEVARKVGMDKANIGRHFELVFDNPRGLDDYVADMAGALGTTPETVWKAAVQSYTGDPLGKLPANRKRQVARARARRGP